MFPALLYQNNSDRPGLIIWEPSKSFSFLLILFWVFLEGPEPVLDTSSEDAEPQWRNHPLTPAQPPAWVCKRLYPCLGEYWRGSWLSLSFSPSSHRGRVFSLSTEQINFRDRGRGCLCRGNDTVRCSERENCPLTTVSMEIALNNILKNNRSCVVNQNYW